MESEQAPDIQEKIDHLIETLDWGHVIGARIICMRSHGASANAYARIWNLPSIWQNALGVSAFYVIEVLSEKFDHLNDEKKTKILIHELMHIPKKFSGGLVPHTHRGGRIDARSVEVEYAKYLQNRANAIK
jgi:predicted metallopeptidase